MGLSVTQVEEARHRFTRRMTNKEQAVSTSHFHTMILGTGQFLLQCSVSPSIQHIAGTAQENELCNSWGAQGPAYVPCYRPAPSCDPVHGWRSEKGRAADKKRAEKTFCHVLWHKDEGSETWLSDPHQNSCSTCPWNRIRALWTLKNPQKMYNHRITRAGWKKNSTKSTDNIYSNKQTRNMDFSQKHIYFKKLKATAIIKTRETGEPHQAPPKRRSLQEVICTVWCYGMITVIFSGFFWLQKLQAGQGSCITELLQIINVVGDVHSSA